MNNWIVGYFAVEKLPNGEYDNSMLYSIYQGKAETKVEIKKQAIESLDENIEVLCIDAEIFNNDPNQNQGYEIYKKLAPQSIRALENIKGLKNKLNYA